MASGDKDNKGKGSGNKSNGPAEFSERPARLPTFIVEDKKTVRESGTGNGGAELRQRHEPTKGGKK
jgi:hypothetical protein